MTSTKKKLANELTKNNNVQFTPNGWNDYNYWSDNSKKLKRIKELTDDAQIGPLHGRGKPERLSGDLKGYYSRRIDSEHRLIYKVIDGGLVIIQARFHY